jgi:hypothetical protein
LKKDNKSLNKRIDVLEKDNSIILAKFERKEELEYFNKLLISIQDINSNYRLETKFKPIDFNISKTLNVIRTKRVFGTHYIYNDKDLYTDSVDVIQYKTNILVYQLANMPENYRNKFEKSYPKIIDALTNTLHVVDVTVDEEDKNQVELWWEGGF